MKTKIRDNLLNILIIIFAICLILGTIAYISIGAYGVIKYKDTPEDQPSWLVKFTDDWRDWK